MKENSFPGSLALWAGSFKPDCLFRQCRHYDTSLHKVGGQTFQGTKKRRHEIEKKKAVEGNLSAEIGRMAIYLGPWLPKASSDLTRPVFPPPGAEGNSNGLFFPLRERGLFGLAPGGVYRTTPITQGTGEPLPHLFTLIPTFVGTVSFLWHFPYSRTLPCRIRGQSVLRTTLPCGARTFLPF